MCWNKSVTGRDQPAAEHMLTLTLLRSKPALRLGTRVERLGGSTGAAAVFFLGAAFFLRGACLATGAFITAACGVDQVQEGGSVLALAVGV
jgi:hypothetical protein